MSKYDPLWNYVKEKNQKEYQLSFEEVKNILGFEMDHSFLTYKKELKAYGYEVEKISLKQKSILIKKQS